MTPGSRLLTLRTAIVIGVALRLALVALAWLLRGTSTFLAPDSSGYLSSAAALASSWEFNDAAGRPEIFRTPGYPLLLATGVLAGHPVWFALGAQIALSAGIVVFTYQAARRLPAAADRTAALCALVVAIEPTMLLWSVKVMPETLLTFFVAAFTVAALLAVETGSLRWTAAAAVALALAAYVKPIAYPLAYLALVALIVLPFGPRRSSYRHAIVFLVITSGFLAPWHLRNARVAGYAGFSTLFDHALYISVGGSLLAERGGRSYQQVRNELLATTPRLATDSAASYAQMRTEGLGLLRAHAGRYARTHLHGMLRTLFDPGAVEYLRLFGAYPETGGALVRLIDRGPVGGLRDLAARRPRAFWASAIMSVLLLPLVILPFVAAARLPPCARPACLLLASLAAYFVVCGGGVPGSSRFRVPVVPLLALMTGFSIAAPGSRAAVAIAARDQ